jgi:hypothetical protein
MEKLIFPIALMLFFVVIWLISGIIMYKKRLKNSVQSFSNISNTLDSYVKKSDELEKTNKQQQDHMMHLSKQLDSMITKEQRRITYEEYKTFALKHVISKIASIIDSNYTAGEANGLKNAITNVEIIIINNPEGRFIKVRLLCHNPKGYNAVQKHKLLNLLKDNDEVEYSLHHYSIWLDGLILETMGNYEND